MDRLSKGRERHPIVLTNRNVSYLSAFIHLLLLGRDCNTMFCPDSLTCYFCVDQLKVKEITLKKYHAQIHQTRLIRESQMDVRSWRRYDLNWVRLVWTYL